MSEIALDKGDFFASPLTEWYRERPFKVALAGSLLIHAALLATIPGFRSVTLEPPQVLNVEIVEEKAPPPVVRPVPRVVQPRPEVVPPPEVQPAPPLPVVEQPARPEPRRVEPEPVQRPRPPEPVRAPEPVVRQPQPDVPPLQPEIIQARPQPERQPDFVTPPTPDPRPVPSVEPRQAPRVEIRPDAPVPRAAPQQPAPVAQPRLDPAPAPILEQPRIASPEAPQVAAPVPPAPVQQAPAQKAAPEAERTLVSSYEKSLSDLIRRHEKYPDRARRQGWEGTAVVGLALSADGKVMDISILESSGRDILDDAALNMVRRASPLPRAPEGLRGKERLVRVPIVFKLHS